MVRYHDEEWGAPCHEDVELFERLVLESFQAGLSWSTILHKRAAFRVAFRGFDPVAVAAFDDADRERLVADAGIVRNRAKIDATIGNAAAWLATGRELGSMDRYFAMMVPGAPIRLDRGAGPDAIPAASGPRSRDTLAVTGRAHRRRMITIECTWCDGELTLESLDATSVDCAECRITVDIAPDSESLAIAA